MDQMTPATELRIERERRGLRPSPPPPAPSQDLVASELVASPKAKRKFTLRRVGAFAGALIAVVALSFYGYRYWTVGRFEESTDDAYVQADSSILAPKVSGYISEVLVDDNQPVKAGQLLAKIDDRDYQTALAQAQANVAAAQADIDNLNASLKEQQAVIAQARATIEVDKAKLTFMQQDNDRYATLAKQGSGTVQAAQQALSKRNIAQANLDHDTALLDAAGRQMSVLQAQLGKAKAVLAQDRALQRQAELNVAYTNIVAPIDGVVGNRTLRVGQYVQAGTQLMAVVPLAATYVVANFEETQLADIQPGEPVDLAVDTYSGKTVRGRVESIAPASGQEFALLPPDNATGNFTKIVQRIPVKIAIERNDPLRGDLRPGMSVYATVNTKADARTIAGVQSVAANQENHGAQP
jgi:membrane fusion protein, multidrug efflux system